MRSTFKLDDCMVITIPLEDLQNVGKDPEMPEKLTCVFFSEVFLQGRPKELAVAQFSIGVFVICVGVILSVDFGPTNLIYTLPSALFIAGGILTYAAGCCPLIPVVKLSLIFNILSLIWALIASVLCLLIHDRDFRGYGHYYWDMSSRLRVLMCVLFGLESMLALVLLFWGFKAVCRSHFNTLPLSAVKQDG